MSIVFTKESSCLHDLSGITRFYFCVSGVILSNYMGMSMGFTTSLLKMKNKLKHQVSGKIFYRQCWLNAFKVMGKFHL